MVYPMNQQCRKPIRIQGIITPVVRDEEGGIMPVSIATFDEEQYLVLRNERSEQLPGLLHEEVEVDGFVSEAGGRKYIKIWTYRVI
jgi:hypothetical protein